MTNSTASSGGVSPGFLNRILNRSRPERLFARSAACIPASLYFVDRDYELQGLVLELSRGGVLFREASSFVLNRRGADIEVRMLDLRWSGTIVNVRPEGYGIRLRQTLDQELLRGLLDNYASAS